MSQQQSDPAQVPDFSVDLPWEGSVALADLHYFGCDAFQVYGYGTRTGDCDCQRTVAALLTAYTTHLTQAPADVPERQTR